jgi:hypothetical protein
VCVRLLCLSLPFLWCVWCVWCMWFVAQHLRSRRALELHPPRDGFDRRSAITGLGAAAHPRTIPRPGKRALSGSFPSFAWTVLTEIYLCHACSWQEIEDGHDPGVEAARAQRTRQQRGLCRQLRPRRCPGGVQRSGRSGASPGCVRPIPVRALQPPCPPPPAKPSPCPTPPPWAPAVAEGWLQADAHSTDCAGVVCDGTASSSARS